jgi:hypothetical protein
MRSHGWLYPADLREWITGRQKRRLQKLEKKIREDRGWCTPARVRNAESMDGKPAGEHSRAPVQVTSFYNTHILQR